MNRKLEFFIRRKGRLVSLTFSKKMAVKKAAAKKAPAKKTAAKKVVKKKAPAKKKK